MEANFGCGELYLTSLGDSIQLNHRSMDPTLIFLQSYRYVMPSQWRCMTGWRDRLMNFRANSMEWKNILVVKLEAPKRKGLCLNHRYWLKSELLLHQKSKVVIISFSCHFTLGIMINVEKCVKINLIWIVCLNDWK